MRFFVLRNGVFTLIKPRFAILKKIHTFVIQNNIIMKLNISNFTSNLSRFLCNNKACMLCLILIMPSINFAKAGIENTMPAPDEMKATIEAAIMSFDKHKTKPDTADAWLSKARTAFNRGQYNKAIKYNKKAIKLNPNLAAAYFSLGNIYKDYKKKYNKAIKCFKKTVELRPSHAFAYLSLGDIYNTKKKNYDEAIKYYEKAIESDPDFWHAYFSLGVVYFRGKQDYDNAIKYFQKTINLYPKDAFAYRHLGYIYHAQGNEEKAIEYYKKAAKLRDEDSQQFLRDKNITWEGNN